jgi:hypothetical protein
MTYETGNDHALAAALEGLRSRLAGALALPGEPGYELAEPWNRSVAVTPAAVVAARDADDIAAAVGFAAASGLRVAVQATGHGAVPLNDDVLLVHTGRMNECTIDPARRTARVGAGVVSRQLLAAAAPHGLAPLVGSAGSVGVAGYLSGGGIGPLVSTYGLSADYVRALDVVTGDGQVRHVTAARHPDLFWGLRGGKATLGIITAVELDLLPLSTIYGGALYFDGADTTEVLHAWSTWSASLPEQSTTSIALAQLPAQPFIPPVLAGRRTVAVRYASIAGPEQAEGLLAPMRAAATPVLDRVGELAFMDIGRIHDEPDTPVPVQQSQTLLSALPPEAIDALLKAAGPESGSPLLLVELRRLGGALARTPQHPSAFSHRHAPYALHTIGLAVPPDQHIAAAAAQATIASVEPWSTGAMFANFASTNDPERIATAYDKDARERLLALAGQYDPAGTLATAGQLGAVRAQCPGLSRQR